MKNYEICSVYDNNANFIPKSKPFKYTSYNTSTLKDILVEIFFCNWATKIMKNIFPENRGKPVMCNVLETPETCTSFLKSRHFYCFSIYVLRAILLNFNLLKSNWILIKFWLIWRTISVCLVKVLFGTSFVVLWPATNLVVLYSSRIMYLLTVYYDETHMHCIVLNDYSELLLL